MISKHSIPKITIKETNSTVYDATDTEKPQATGCEIGIESVNGEYVVDFNLLLDNSTNFIVGDYILIKGSALTGEDEVNDLKLDITAVDAANKIDAIEIDTANVYTARVPLF